MSSPTEVKKPVAKREASKEADSDDKVSAIKPGLNLSRAGIRFHLGVSALMEYPSKISIFLSLSRISRARAYLIFSRGYFEFAEYSFSLDISPLNTCARA